MVGKDHKNCLVSKPAKRDFFLSTNSYMVDFEINQNFPYTT